MGRDLPGSNQQDLHPTIHYIASAITFSIVLTSEYTSYPEALYLFITPALFQPSQKSYVEKFDRKFKHCKIEMN